MSDILLFVVREILVFMSRGKEEVNFGKEKCRLESVLFLSWVGWCRFVVWGVCSGILFHGIM